jgi:5-formyltetrahydrofolate cyclo-ligase
MTKDQLRKAYKEKRSALSAAEKAKLEDLILIQFQKLDIEIPSLIMTYAVLEKMNEFDPLPITDYCYFKNPGQVLFYPVIDPNSNVMQSVVVTDDTEFELNRFGIPEPVNAMPMFPEEIDLIFVPLLAYDKKGHRVGYGKGYYDRFLKECKDDCVKIGFSFFGPEDSIEGVNRHDIKLDYCITPDRIYSF